MKYLAIFIGITFLNIPAFSQLVENENIDKSLEDVGYKKFGASIIFEDGFLVIEKKPAKSEQYFDNSIEIVRFNLNTKSKDPNRQLLLSELQPPTLDSINFQIDTVSLFSAETLTEEKESLKTEKTNSLSNSFSYYTYLSALFIMPQKSRNDLMKEISEYVKSCPNFQITEEVETIKIGNKKILKWRAQEGKTRLDHFVVFGKEFNYLFVSSPYGTNGVIEDMILKMELEK